MRKSKDQAGLAGGAKFFYTVTMNRQMPISNVKFHVAFNHDALMNNEFKPVDRIPTKPMIWGKDFIVAEIKLRV